MTIDIGIAQLADQGKLGPLLIEAYGPQLEIEFEAARKANFATSSVEDELMAADDFYFSTVDLMDCCFLAKRGGELIGAACINPYVSELQYVAVKAGERRQRIGEKLVRLALEEMTKRGCDHIRADTSIALADSGALSFLLHMGFHEIRRYLVMGNAL